MSEPKGKPKSRLATLRQALTPSAVRGALRSASLATREPPEPSARIGSDGPYAGVVMPDLDLHSTLVRYEALTPDPQKWFTIMRRADYGDTSAMIDLFSDARDRDAHLDGVARKRVQSMMGRPIAFKPPEGLEKDREALDISERVRRLILNDLRFTADGVDGGFRSALQHLMSAGPNGYAAAPINWRKNKRGEYVPDLIWAHSNRFGFHRDTRRIGFYENGRIGSWAICPLEEYPDQFVAHVPMNGKSDYAWRRGSMRSCIVPSFIKREDLRFWLVLTERFGMPQPYAIVPKGYDDDGQSSTSMVQQVKAALLGLSRTWTAVFGEGIRIESIPGSGNISADAHKALLDWAEMTQSIAMLGQNLSTKVEGGSFAAAEAHRYVAGDIHLADATELGETVTRQIIEPLVRYNWPGAPVPVCEISTGQKQVVTSEMVQGGIFSPDEMRRSLGYEALPGGVGADVRAAVELPTKPGPDAPADNPMRPDDADTTGNVTTAPADAKPIEAAPDAAPEVEQELAPDAEAKDPQAALNGAQVDALKGIIADVASSLIPRATGIELIVASFPIGRDQAEQIMGTVGAGFTPPEE